MSLKTDTDNYSQNIDIPNINIWYQDISWAYHQRILQDFLEQLIKMYNLCSTKITVMVINHADDNGAKWW